MWGSSFACPVASEKILLVGTLDPRFIISTIAKHPRVQFYVIENQAPVIARHVLLLDIFFMLQIPAQERIDLFLEVYANILLRDKTAQWINEYVSTLINHLVAPHPFLDFSLLKFRERDDIEQSRLLQHLGRQYDSRQNSFDWDYHMKLTESDKRAAIIYKKEYLQFRETGVAFDIRNSVADKDNRTLASVDLLLQDGVKTPKWGIFGDISVGPFVSFGLDSQNKDLLKTNNGKHVHSSQQVAEFNLSEWFKSWNGELDFRVRFLPCDYKQTLSRLKYSGFFDTILLSSSYSHLVKESSNCLANNGTLMVEKASFALELNAAQKQKYEQMVHDLAAESKLNHQSQHTDDFLIFSKQSQI